MERHSGGAVEFGGAAHVPDVRLNGGDGEGVEADLYRVGEPERGGCGRRRSRWCAPARCCRRRGLPLWLRGWWWAARGCPWGWRGGLGWRCGRLGAGVGVCGREGAGVVRAGVCAGIAAGGADPVACGGGPEGPETDGMGGNELLAGGPGLAGGLAAALLVVVSPLGEFGDRGLVGLDGDGLEEFDGLGGFLGFEVDAGEGGEGSGILAAGEFSILAGRRPCGPGGGRAVDAAVSEDFPGKPLEQGGVVFERGTDEFGADGGRTVGLRLTARIMYLAKANSAKWAGLVAARIWSAAARVPVCYRRNRVGGGRRCGGAWPEC